MCVSWKSEVFCDIKIDKMKLAGDSKMTEDEIYNSSAFLGYCHLQDFGAGWKGGPRYNSHLGHIGEGCFEV